MLLVWALGTTNAETLTGHVIGIADGDTLTVQVERQRVRVRINGWAMPRSSQVWPGGIGNTRRSRPRKTVGATSQPRTRRAKDIAVSGVICIRWRRGSGGASAERGAVRECERRELTETRQSPAQSNVILFLPKGYGPHLQMRSSGGSPPVFFLF